MADVSLIIPTETSPDTSPHDVHMPTRRCVVVLGMHRSGTSALTRVANLMGGALPDDLLGPAAGNEEGHWESNAVRLWSDRFLGAVGMGWDDWRAVDLDACGSGAWPEATAALADIVREKTRDAAVFVIKDPRLCRLYPLLEAALERIGASPFVVLALRSPVDVIDSLAARDALPRRHAGLIWLRHVLVAEASTRHTPRVLVRYEALMADWRREVARITAAGAPLDAASVDAAGVDAFLRPDLRHFAAQSLDDPDLTTWARRAYPALLSLEADPYDPAAMRELDAVREDFDAVSAIFAGSVAEHVRRQGWLSQRIEITRTQADQDVAAAEEQARQAVETAEARARRADEAEAAARRSAEAAEARAQQALEMAEARVRRAEEVATAAQQEAVGAQAMATQAKAALADMQKDAAEARTAAARAAVAVRDAEALARLNVETAERDAAAASVERELLHQEIVVRDADLAQLRAELESLQAQLSQTGVYAAMAAIASRRRGRRTGGYDTDTLLPFHDIEPNGQPHGWRTLGPDPQILLPIAAEPGFVRVRFAATLSQTVHEARWQLFMDYGDGFNEADSIAVPFSGDRIDVDVTAWLRAPAIGFRLDPVDQVVEFTVDSFQLDKASAAAVRLRYATKHIVNAWRRGSFWRGAATIVRGLARGDAGPWRALFTPPNEEPYARFVAQRRMTPELRARFVAKAAGFARQPTFSILMPTYNSRADFLERAVETVLDQTYPHWELILVDDGSPQRAQLEPTLRRIAARDPRIKLRLLEKNVGISAATNVALEMASGEFVALMDHDDEIAPQALHAMADVVNRNPDVDWIYSDEDKIDSEGRRFGPFFKPDWSPAFFLSCMYTCHLGVYRRRLVQEIGGFRSDYDFAQDYDMALRVASATDRVAHVPDVLYHWRTLPESTASGADAKPEAERRARAAVQDYIDRSGLSGTASAGPLTGSHRADFAIAGRPLVSLAILTAGKRNLADDGWFVLDLARSIRDRTTYAPIEIVVADNGDLDPALAAALDALDVRCATFRFTGRFNLPEKMNFLVEQTQGEYVTLLNDDMTVQTADWVEQMLMWAQQDGVAGVGAKLLFPDGRIQHAGVTMLGQGPSHLYYLHPSAEIGYGGNAASPREVAAVTGACMMMRRADYLAVGGFDPAFRINYNDVDFCLRLRRDTGKRIVWTPRAVLTHFESVSREAAPADELARIKDRWPDVFGRDPWYNLNLSQYSNNYSLSATPLPLEGVYGV